MRIPGFIMAVLCVVFVCDLYIFLRLRKRWRNAAIVHAVVSILLYAILAAGLIVINRGQTDGNVRFMMWCGFTFLSFSTAKITAVFFDLISMLPRIWHAANWKFLSATGMVLSILIFAGMWWGALVNRFRIDINNVEVVIPDLPEGFDGFRIAQFSDLHTGTFGTDTTFTSRLVDEINALDADLIVFTGDIVNSRSEEIVPHLRPLSRLKAKGGVMSILGNHDYGDYFRWDSDIEKENNLNFLKQSQRDMGWSLMLNTSETLKNKGDSIVIIGVENIGDPPFKCYGSLNKSYAAASDSIVKILLSHNPAHWVDSIADNPGNNIALTLSGHTHAMQIEAFGLSPAAFKYKTWGGLYHDTSGQRKLYVNIGSGTVGLPMRFGATPEITLITLRKQPSDAK